MKSGRGGAQAPPPDINSLDDAMRAYGLLTESDLAGLERRFEGKEGPDAQKMARLVSEYRLCRTLLRTALDQRSRILNWPAAAGGAEANSHGQT